MIFKWMKFIILLLLCSTIYFVGNFGLPFIPNSSLPPVGKLVNPYTGFWQNGSQIDEIEDTKKLSELKDEVNVYYDERKVPHIFAKNNHDLYYTFGYIVAKNRLWEMDFISRVAGGNLSSAVGEKAVEYDIFNRRLGLLESAEKTVEQLKQNKEVYASLDAFVNGVNQYIDELDEDDLPVEYKLMNYKPEHWSMVKSALILKYLAWDLDGGIDDRFVANAKKVYSDSLFQALYPLENPIYEPIVKKQYRRKRTSYASRTFSYDQYGNKVYSYTNNNLRYFVQPDLGDVLMPSKPDLSYIKGSNNWAVSGKKTRSGNPILANDPHLGLTLPSVWYEVQLNNGSDLNTYGASVPGVPFIVIGFNQDTANALTYTTSDVIDYTNIQLNADKSQYKLDGQWTNPRIRIDTINVKNGDPRIVRTLITEVGPVIYTEQFKRTFYNERIPGVNVAMNWTGTHTGSEFETFYELNRAKNLNDIEKALPKFNAPGQNMLFITKNNDIALWHNAKIPVRSAEQARTIADSATSDLIWDKFIPRNELPKVVNPSSGYIFSANQAPVKGYFKYYLGSDDYAPFDRANRINHVLDSLDTITPYDFQKLQLDNYSVFAERLLPYLLKKLNQNGLGLEQNDVLNELKSWNYEFNANSKSPVIFNTWVQELKNTIFNDEVNNPDGLSYMQPRDDVMANMLLTDSLNVVYDNVKTAQLETQRDIINYSFATMVQKLTEKYGSLNDSWKWSSVNPTEIKSLGSIPGFGVNNLRTGGSKRSVNAISNSHGPSWRMIVELGKDRPKAYGVYPGGQSGHPGSEHYNQFVNDWSNGEYYELTYMLNQKDDEQITQTTKFKPE